MAKVQHYKVLMLGAKIQDFREGAYSDPSPIATALDTYLTFLSLLGSWPEEAEPFTEARVLAQTKMAGQEQRYLLEMLNKVDHASQDELLAIAERKMDEYQKLVNTLRRQVKLLELGDNERLTRINELLAEVRTLTGDNAETVAELRESVENERRLEDEKVGFENKIDDLEEDNIALRANLERAEQELEHANTSLDQAQTTIDRLITERDELEREVEGLKEQERG